jgi:hypothetical protein
MGVSVLASFDHEVPTKRRNKPSNIAVNEREELAASGRADAAAFIGKFGTQRERIQRLKEHSEQILAEMRVS